MINNYGNFLGNTWIYLITVLPCVFFPPITFLIDIYLIVINCTLIMPGDELSEQLFDSRAVSYLSFFLINIR